MNKVNMTVNGRPVSRAVEGRRLLVEFLREDLGLTGTHVGCDTSQCGACVVHVNGKAVKSCTMFVLEAESADVTTIEAKPTKMVGSTRYSEHFRIITACNADIVPQVWL